MIILLKLIKVTDSMNESPILHTNPYLKTDAANAQELPRAGF